MKCKNLLPIVAILFMVMMVGCKKYVNPGVRPVVTATNPVNQATHVAINSKISVMFNVEMDPATINSSNFTLQQGTTTVSGVIVYAGNTASFTPAANLAPNTLYTATITTGVQAISGINIIKNYTWTFTTSSSSDLTPPTIALTNPANNTTGVALNQLIVATFSEPMDPTTITNFTLIVKQGSTIVTGEVTYSGTAATFTPARILEPNKIYTATITTGAKDMAGNAMSSNNNFSFTTGDALDISLPMVNATDPLNNATAVALNKVVATTFSKAMDPLTINTTTFTLKQGATVVPGTVTYSGTTAKYTPSNPLVAGTTYTATITTGAKDIVGNALAANISWSFTTGITAAGLAVVNLGTAGNYVILAKTAISNVPTSAITGDLGLSPAATSYITGFGLTNATGYATSPQVTGKIFAADMVSPTSMNLTTAVEDMILAYTDAAGRPTPDFLELGTGNIGGKILTPGLYKWTTSVTMPNTVTISGSANDVWIFQISGNMNMSSAVKIILNGGAQAKNIFWQVAGQVTLGINSHFEGVILSKSGISFQTGASINGRALAQTAVALDKNTVNKPQ